MADSKKKLSIAQKILNRKKDPALMKQLDSEQLDIEAAEPVVQKPKKKSKEPDEIEEIVKKSKLQAANLLKKRQRKRLIIASPFVIVIGYFIYWFNTPYYAGLDYGFCRVFLELNVQYPDRLRLSEIEEKRDFVRIWYMQTDSFGQERLENIECYHGQDPELGYFIEKVRVDRREIDPAKVARFNKSLTTIVAYPPDLAHPVKLRDALGNIDIQTYLFRKPIF
ncbi:MAG: hypothetical protein AB8B83_01505 [Bdellovibrionales bacterium]